MARHTVRRRIPRWAVAVPLSILLVLGAAQAWASSTHGPATSSTSSRGARTQRSDSLLSRVTAAVTGRRRQDKPNSPTPGGGTPTPDAGTTTAASPSRSTTAPDTAHRDGAGGTHPSDQQKNTHQNGRQQQNQPNPNCTLVVPASPTSAAGLATPYRLQGSDGKGACHEANTQQSAFVEATIVDPVTGALSVYHPLVIDDGTPPAATPPTPALPADAVVGVWFGFNGTTLTLAGDHGGCVNGTLDSPFGQVAYCNAATFFRAANTAIAAGKLTVPPLGTAADGQPCPTTRDFAVVDQDQSDNLATSYRVLGGGRVAQDSAANAGLGGTLLTNASDNGLLDAFVDPALGCRPMTAPDAGDSGRQVPALALNELQAAAHQGAPVAVVPANDPMVLVDDNPSAVKTALYREGVDQPVAASSDGAAYCRSLVAVAPGRLKANQTRFSAATTPDPAAATNLFTFLAQRLQASYQNLGCGDLGAPKLPLTVKKDGDTAVAATITG
jgi:hypothetical protein